MVVLAEELEALPRLEQLGASKDKLLEVVQASVAAKRRASNTFYARNGAGQLSYQEGTAHLRRTFLPLGYEVCREDNIEAIYNPKTGIKIVFQNADRAGHPLHDPLATSDKGPGSERAVVAGQYELFQDIRASEVKKAGAPVWYLFTYAVGDDVRAELSCPKQIENKQFSGFHERILLLQKGDWGGIDLTDDKTGPLDFDVPVSRKS